MDDLFGDEEERETQALEVLAREYIDADREASELEKQAKSAKADARAKELRLWDALAESKTKTTTLELGEGYGDVQVGKRQTDTATILNEEMLEKALKADPGLAAQVLEPTQKIRKRVLNQVVRNLNKAGKPLPDGADIHERPFVQLSFKK